MPSPPSPPAFYYKNGTESGCSYTQIGEMCSPDAATLCGTNGEATGTPVCENTYYTSGDLEYDHPCKASGSFDVACIQQLCDSSALCGGYQTETDGSSYWLYSTDLAATGNNLYQCWEKLCPGVFFAKTTLEAAVADVTQAEATHGPLAGWDVSRIDDMEMLFRSTNVQNFNGDVSKWDTARVTTFKRTVSGPHAAASPSPAAQRAPLAARPSAANPPSPPQWEEARSFNADVSKWDTARATDFVNMVRATPRRGAASVPSPAARSAPRRASPPLTASRRPPDCSSG